MRSNGVLNELSDAVAKYSKAINIRKHTKLNAYVRPTISWKLECDN